MSLIKRVLFALLLIVTFYAVAIIFCVGRNKDKIWLHRCNSIEKFVEQREDYPNVEIDLVFRDSGYFDVTHDAPVSFDLPLDSFFAHPENHGKMWLDIKNLSNDNANAILSELERLTAKYQVDKERLIIESSSWKELSAFTNAGFYTSYYFPHGNPSKLSDTECTEALEELKLVAKNGNFKAVSFPFWWYEEISDTMADTNHDLLTWQHRSTEYGFLLTGGFQMLNDERLKVILIKSKGEYHR